MCGLASANDRRGLSSTSGSATCLMLVVLVGQLILLVLARDATLAADRTYPGLVDGLEILATGAKLHPKSAEGYLTLAGRVPEDVRKKLQASDWEKRQSISTPAQLTKAASAKNVFLIPSAEGLVAVPSKKLESGIAGLVDFALDQPETADYVRSLTGQVPDDVGTFLTEIVGELDLDDKQETKRDAIKSAVTRAAMIQITQADQAVRMAIKENGAAQALSDYQKKAEELTKVTEAWMEAQRVQAEKELQDLEQELSNLTRGLYRQQAIIAEMEAIREESERTGKGPDMGRLEGFIRSDSGWADGMENRPPVLPEILEAYRSVTDPETASEARGLGEGYRKEAKRLTEMRAKELGLEPGAPLPESEKSSVQRFAFGGALLNDAIATGKRWVDWAGDKIAEVIGRRKEREVRVSRELPLYYDKAKLLELELQPTYPDVVPLPRYGFSGIFLEKGQGTYLRAWAKRDIGSFSRMPPRSDVTTISERPLHWTEWSPANMISSGHFHANRTGIFDVKATYVHKGDRKFMPGRESASVKIVVEDSPVLSVTLTANPQVVVRGEDTLVTFLIHVTLDSGNSFHGLDDFRLEIADCDSLGPVPPFLDRNDDFEVECRQTIRGATTKNVTISGLFGPFQRLVTATASVTVTEIPPEDEEGPEEEPQKERLIVTPPESVIKVGETVTLTAQVVAKGSNPRDVTNDPDILWISGPVFKGEKPGAFTVTAIYDRKVASATVIVEEEKKPPWKPPPRVEEKPGGLWNILFKPDGTGRPRCYKFTVAKIGGLLVAAPGVLTARGTREGWSVDTTGGAGPKQGWAWSDWKQVNARMLELSVFGKDWYGCRDDPQVVTPPPGVGQTSPLPPGTIAYGIWRKQASFDPPNCYQFHAAPMSQAPVLDARPGWRREPNFFGPHAKASVNAVMSQLSRYGGDYYGCLTQGGGTGPTGAGGGGTPGGTGTGSGGGGPGTGGPCPHVPGWTLPAGTTCHGSGGGTPTTCPPGQHWSRDLGKCHAGN